ncbi:MAG: hypothetical protein K0S04_109, partial [Herbinix sp.]|nr:hypothetical protein [Herbinix sp.]
MQSIGLTDVGAVGSVLFSCVTKDYKHEIQKIA